MPDEPDNLPPRLQQRLRELEPPVSVPPGVDDAVLRAARDVLPELRRRHRWRLVAHRLAPATAAAAVLALTIFLAAPFRGSADPRDASADGRVDVLDALAIARALERGSGIESAWDINGDGRVTAADADALAQQIVRLPDEPAGGGA